MYPGCKEATGIQDVYAHPAQAILMVWRQAAELGRSLAKVLTKVKGHRSE